MSKAQNFKNILFEKGFKSFMFKFLTTLLYQSFIMSKTFNSDYHFYHQKNWIKIVVLKISDVQCLMFILIYYCRPRRATQAATYTETTNSEQEDEEEEL